MAASDLQARLRARGLRLTPQRELVLHAVASLEHGTPEDILTEVRRTASGVNVSTVYRTLELLERLGLVTHTHLGRTTPSYHLADQAEHLHLVCRQCAEVAEVPVDVARDLAARLLAEHGFEADLQHVALHGRCRACREDPSRGSSETGDES